MPLDDYEEIVEHFENPTLVLAGPGAGKTYLLADRIKRLLDRGVDKDKITGASGLFNFEDSFEGCQIR